MKVAQIETTPIVVPLRKTFRGSCYSMSHRATLITRIYTDDGLVGVAYNGDEVDTQHEITRIINDEFFPLIEGMDPVLVERCLEAVLPPTFDILRNRRLVVQAHLRRRQRLVGHRRQGGWATQLSTVGWVSGRAPHRGDRRLPGKERRRTGCRSRVVSRSRHRRVQDEGRWARADAAGGSGYLTGQAINYEGGYVTW